MYVVARTASDSSSTTAAILHLVNAMNPDVPVYDIATDGAACPGFHGAATLRDDHDGWLCQLCHDSCGHRYLRCNVVPRHARHRRYCHPHGARSTPDKHTFPGLPTGNGIGDGGYVRWFDRCVWTDKHDEQLAFWCETQRSANVPFSLVFVTHGCGMRVSISCRPSDAYRSHGRAAIRVKAWLMPDSCPCS